jgi:hypothetical protein
MGGFAMAWLLGEGIVTWRWIKAGAPPTPGSIALSSGFFVLLGLVAASNRAAVPAMTALAFGVDIAALLQVLPGSAVHPATGWPPPLITDNTIILPTGHSHAAPAPYGNQSGGSGPGGTTPKGPNTLPPGTPPPPGQGVIFPPGSGTL